MSRRRHHKTHVPPRCIQWIWKRRTNTMLARSNNGCQVPRLRRHPTWLAVLTEQEGK